MGGKENSFVGSLINGLGTNALAGNDVRKGLMINAALLAGSGGLSGLGTGATQVAGTGSALTGPTASTAANTAFMNPAGVNAGANAAMGASQSAATASDLALDAANASYGGYTGQGMAGNPAANMSLLDKLGSGASAIGQYAQENPVLTQMAMQTGQSLLQSREPQLQSPGLMRGTQMQVAAPQYQVGIPKVSLIQVIYGNYRLHP